jgi:hypothetical protein
MSDPRQTIEEHSSRVDSFGGWGELALLAIGTANIPLGLMLCVGMQAHDAVRNHKSDIETPMPDEWLQEASESPDVSSKGLAHLAKCLDRQGFVSVRDAKEWAKIEENEAKAKADKEDRHSRLQGDGAKALLLRAKRECPSLLSNLDFDRALDGIRQGGKAATSFAATLKVRVTQPRKR